MRINKFSWVALALAGSALLAACGGGGGGSTPSAPSVASSNTVATMNATTGPAIVASVLGQSFGFAGGVPAFGTTGPTSLALSGSNTAPSFAISSAGGTAKGSMAFGSCIFKITESTFVAPSPLALGATITISPCAITVATAGAVGDGSSAPRDVTINLGGTGSTPIKLTVSISATGVVTVNGASVGSVTLTPSTGVTGTGAG